MKTCYLPGAPLVIKWSLEVLGGRWKWVFDRWDAEFDFSFSSVIVKIDPFPTLCWVNNDEAYSATNFHSPLDNIFITVTKNKIYCLKLLFLRPNGHLFVRIEQYWHIALVFYCWVWICRWWKEYFIALI